MTTFTSPSSVTGRGRGVGGSLLLAAASVAVTWSVLTSAQVGLFEATSLLIVGLGVFNLALGVTSDRSGPMQLLYWPFVVVTMGVAPLAQSKTGVFPRADIFLSEYYFTAQLLTLSCSVVYSLFYFRGHGGARDVEATEPETSDRRLRLALGLALTSFPLSLASGLSLASRFQSRDDLIAAYGQAGISYENESVQLALLKLLPTILAVSAATIAAYEVSLRRRSETTTVSPFAVTVAIAAALSFVVFANPLSNNRYTAFSALLAVMFAAVPFRTRALRGILAAGLVIGLVVVYPASAAFKNQAVGERVSLGIEAFGTVDFDSMQQTANAFYYTEARGHTDGIVTLSAVLFFVPRQIWEQKSLPSSYLTSEARGYGPLNLSQPLWSEFYLDFGWIGALLLFGAFGQLSGRLDRRFNTARGSTVLLVAAAAGLQVGFLRGPMGAVAIYSATTLLILFFAARLRESASPHHPSYRRPTTPR